MRLLQILYVILWSVTAALMAVEFFPDSFGVTINEGSPLSTVTLVTLMLALAFKLGDYFKDRAAQIPEARDA